MFPRAALLILTFFLVTELSTYAQDKPLSPLQAAATMQVPDGFSVSLFAGEPDLKQPIAFCIDDRGRLWVAEANNYPSKKAGFNDRILIYEDQDNDGHFDKRTVFYDKLEYVTGIEVGFGGAWVMSPPNLYFIPDRDGDDIPDSEPQILLNGFGTAFNAHNIANGFSWGPDGWLYGCHGRTNWSMPAKPGTPEKQRTRFDGGIYRYHPVRHIWEPFSDGTTNPWGIDFNDYGQAFTCNCVNPHLFHMIQGAHYDPWRNRQSSQFAYQRIQSIADHLHYSGSSHTFNRGTQVELEVGGGHAHCGTMIYLGDSWPKKYRNTVFMNNTHGRRMNNDLLRRKGSGYTASHEENLLVSKDPWFMGVTIRYGPDGSVFVSDWSDTGECHSIKDTRKDTGRIYKITYGSKKTYSRNLAKNNNQQLVDLQLHANDWWVRHARRLLQERAAAGQDMSQAHQALRKQLNTQSAATHQLRALWALHVTGGAAPDLLLKLLSHQNEYLRAWAVQLLCENGDPSTAQLAKLAQLANNDPAAIVRLYLASALQRLPHHQRWDIATALLSHGEDSADANLPLMIWYGIEALINSDVPRFAQLISHSKIPLIRQHIARRISSQAADKTDQDLPHLLALLSNLDTQSKVDTLSGINQGLSGRKQLSMPKNWQPVHLALLRNSDSQLREQATLLSLRFGDPKALSELRQLAADAAVASATRLRSIEALLQHKDPQLPDLLIQLIKDKETRAAAIRGLASYQHPQTSQILLASYADFDKSNKQNAIQTLASRPLWAIELLKQIRQQRLPKSDVSAFTLRQIAAFKNPAIDQQTEQIWGKLRATPKDKARLIAQFKKKLSSAELEKADPTKGRQMFQRTCMACHQLFGEGVEIGPDLTGSDRRNLDYILENVIDPNAFVAKDYQITTIETRDGRVITGMVKSEDANAIAMQTLNEELILPLEQIQSRKAAPLSMMPEGLVQTMTFEQFRDLIRYLASDRQLPAAK
ncbi:MAG: c-type cytochrome [Verrucomicrobiales bacterium]|nr:c-type cytochrome [Verrucomicrobiales bacterium]